MALTLTEELCLFCGICCNGMLFKDVQMQAGDAPALLREAGLPVATRRGKRLFPQPCVALARVCSPVLKAPYLSQKKTGRTSGRVLFGSDFRCCEPLGLEQCYCRCYAVRPAHCRHFECALFQAVGKGTLNSDAARRIIRTTRQRAERIHRMLRQLGDENEHLALSLRFRRLTRRFQAAPVERKEAEIFSRLTLAMHALNLRLRKSFYP